VGVCQCLGWLVSVLHVFVQGVSGGLGDPPSFYKVFIPTANIVRRRTPKRTPGAVGIKDNGPRIATEN
jgi:hypothetical protein